MSSTIPQTFDNSIEIIIFDKVKALFSDDTIDGRNFMIILIKSMEHVEEFQKLTGLQKKTTVKNIFKHLIQESNVDVGFDLSDDTLDIFIDTIISVSKGYFKLNKFNFKNFFSKLNCFFKKRLD